MSEGVTEPEWLQRERDYDDELYDRGTLPELFETSAERHLDEEAQLYKGGIYDRSMAGIVPEAPDGDFASITYRRMREIVRNFATGFRELGLDVGDRVGIFANTRMEWAQADLGLLAAGCVVTTVYTDSSPSQAQYLLGDSEATGVVVENESLLERLFEIEDELSLEYYVLIDEPAAEYDRDDIYTLSDVHDLGEANYDEATYESWLDDGDADDLASLVYTSGTTSQPKGVRLTHWNFRSNFHALRARAGPRPDEPDRRCIDDDTVALSFLPLAHVFARMGDHIMIFGTGATVGYAESTDTVAEDFSKVKPTGGGSVPRVYERMFKRMRKQASSSPIKKKIFDWGIGVAKDYQMAEDPGPLLRFKHSVADRLVYSTVKEKLGGNIEIFVSGGGSLSIDLARIFNGMGIQIVEGYGLTETSPVISINSPDEIQPGTVGVPLINLDVIVDQSKGSRDELDLTHPESNVGELLVRGPSVTEGYWNKPGATERAFTADPFDDDEAEVEAPPTVAVDGSGKWFRTGDLVEQRPDSFLVIHDRLKQLIVLDTGKNIPPQPIEDEFSTRERIEQIMVVGDDEKFIGALIVPNFEALAEWAETNDVDLPASREAMVNDDRVHEWVSEEVTDANKQFEKHEQIKKFALVPEEWTPENELLTPSMKKKRRDIISAFEENIDEIYEE